MSALLLILLSAVLINAAAATSTAGWRPFVAVSDAYATARAVAGATLLVAPIAATASWLLAKLVLAPWGLGFLRTFAFVAVLLLVTSIVEAALRRYTHLDPQQPGFGLLMTCNGAALGMAILAQTHMRSAFDALLFSVAAALALAVLLLAFVSLHERLRAADTPAAFRDAPLALISAGLIALAFMGFTGIIQE